MSSRSSTTASGAAERRRPRPKARAGAPIAPRPGPYTFEDFCALVGEDQKADLIDGVIYMASPDNTDANTLFGWLFAVMSSYADERRLGEVFGSRVAFRLGDLGSPEPDIAFLRAENAARIRPGYVEGPPDLAVEIVSPESVERDYVAKRHQYQQARVPEYWILDEENTAVLLLRLDARGRYREARPRQGVLYSRVLEDFWLRPAWLWQSPRPSRFGVVQQLLAGGPGE